MYLHVSGLLQYEQLKQVNELLAQSEFKDGKVSAHGPARDVKNNLQLERNDSGEPTALEQIVMQALYTNPLVQAAIVPKYFAPILFSRYSAGMQYGWHTDSPVMGSNPPVRTDVAVTIFLSDPMAYEGGELVLRLPTGEQAFKFPKGDAILYPTYHVHKVAEVRSGTRTAAVTWVQSVVRDTAQRELLFNLNTAYGLVSQKNPHAPEAELLLQSYSNLLRMWADV